MEAIENSETPHRSVKRQVKIGVVIPCYGVRNHILSVIERIGSECAAIYVVDDKCPEETGKYVAERCTDRRVTVLYHHENQGVGGATLTGYNQAVADGMTIVVKIDGDGQMDPGQMMKFVHPILKKMADYTKGNRFYNIEAARNMPALRQWGNAVLSFLSKLSTGYWNLFDPTNGYTAIHAAVIRELPLAKISRGYFFESDLLFHLNIIRAKAIDVPMDAIYANETSHLLVWRILGEFLYKHTINLFKRIFYNYFLRDFSLASVELVVGLGLLFFGVSFGVSEWAEVLAKGVAATSGTVMLAALPVVLGAQLVLAFLAYDIYIVPTTPIAPLLLGQSDEDLP